jgi:acetyl/propionyl-CoA carboxylase alpha subunit
MSGVRVRIDGAVHEVDLAGAGATWRWVGPRLELALEGRSIEAHVVRGARGGLELWIGGERHLVEEVRGAGGDGAGGGASAADESELTAPMPAKIVRVNVAAGDAVTDGQALVVLESMKMELTVTAPRAGRVRRVGADVIPGAIVAAGTLLVELEPPSPTPANA